jgi:2-C-methyl-D-erythritol 2,4-cyclodiphosphate synthase
MLEQPRLRPYIEEMRARLAGVLGVEIECVSVKAKSGEGLDAVGEGRAVTVQAVGLLERT